MTGCEARIPILVSPTLTIREDGYPVGPVDFCGAKTDLESFWDAVGQEHHYCGRLGHERDVRRRAEYADELRLRRLERLVRRTA